MSRSTSIVLFTLLLLIGVPVLFWIAFQGTPIDSFNCLGCVRNMIVTFLVAIGILWGTIYLGRRI